MSHCHKHTLRKQRSIRLPTARFRRRVDLQPRAVLHQMPCRAMHCSGAEAAAWARAVRCTPPASTSPPPPPPDQITISLSSSPEQATPVHQLSPPPWTDIYCSQPASTRRHQPPIIHDQTAAGLPRHGLATCPEDIHQCRRGRILPLIIHPALQWGWKHHRLLWPDRILSLCWKMSRQHRCLQPKKRQAGKRADQRDGCRDELSWIYWDHCSWVDSRCC